MMKGIDNKIFLGLLLISFIIGILLYDNTFDRYSDMITFLSIMVGFKIWFLFLKKISGLFLVF